jgi:hypothetical protein
MKLAAHPLVVAVAMGLLGPSALDVVDGEGPLPCADCDADDSAETTAAVAFQSSVSATADSVEAWLALPAPSEEAQALALSEYLRNA